VNAYAWLDDPPAWVAVAREGASAAFFYRVACARCRAVETTYSPTEANAICIEHARCKDADCDAKAAS
jgi:ribosomal protein S27E